MNAGYIVDIGGTTIKFGVCGVSSDEPLIVIDTPKNRKDIINSVATVISKLKTQYPETKQNLVISAPGLITIDGHIEKSLYADLSQLNLKYEITQKCNCEVIIENDANLQALGRYNNKNLLYLVIGTAVGGAYINENGIFKGSKGFACEFGHIFIGEDRKCFCGKTGCLDTVVSGRIIANLFGESWWLKKEDSSIRHYLKYAGEKTALAIESLAILFDPDEICICGNICEFSDFSEAVTNTLKNNNWNICEIDIQKTTWGYVYKGAYKLLDKFLA